MDLPTPNFYQSKYVFSSLEESVMEGAGIYTKPQDDLFSDTFSNDPICKMSLQETSNFLKPFPVSIATSSSSMEGRQDLLNFSAQRRKQERRPEAPPTPGRPVFSFSVARKGFPSKWDDAQKWLSGSNSCHESPAHPAIRPSQSSSSASFEVARPSVMSDEYKLQLDDFGEKCRVTNQKVASFTDSVSFALRQQLKQQQQLNPTKAYCGVSPSTDVLLKDKFTDDVEPVFTQDKYSEPSKEGFMFRNPAGIPSQDASIEVVHEVQHRDIGTEMTPIGSSTTSRCPTPFKSSSPARHNTPADRSGPLPISDPSSANSSSINISQLQKCHLAKLQLGTRYDSTLLNWSSRQEEEEEVSKSLRHFDNGYRRSYSESRTAAWEDEENTKCCLRYQREEAKIQAWVNLQNAKAEAQSKKLEVKIERLRSNLEEKLMKRMAMAHRKAEEWRAAAQLQHSAQIKKASDQAVKFVNRHANFTTHKSSCGCFPCSNNNLYF